jgi:KipI family sensor histidine kinase inhibitor
MADPKGDIQPLGDSAFLVRFSGPEGEARAQALVQAVSNANPEGLRDVAAAYDAAAVYYDPLVTSPDTLTGLLHGAFAKFPTADATPGELHTIAVIYDGTDLEYVAAQTGLSSSAIVDLHSSVEYTAHAIGFVPGFAYLGELEERLRLPRRSTPRPRVLAGSVAIAGAHTAVYPFATPGGWHLIGRTETVMFDADRSPPSLLSVGGRVRFVPR